MINLLISLSESDKRLLIALLLVLILVFVLIGYLGMLIIRIMKWQGKKIDNAVADVLYARVVTNKKHFRKYAMKKNWRLFFKEAWIPLLIIITGSLVLIIRNAITNDWGYKIFDMHHGFSSLLFLWDFSSPDYYTQVFGLKILAKWPPLINTPHFVGDAWASYIFVIFITIGGLWYLWALQSLISRTIRIFGLCRSVFAKNLDNYNQNEELSKIFNNPANTPQNTNDSGPNPQ